MTRTTESVPTTGSVAPLKVSITLTGAHALAVRQEAMDLGLSHEDALRSIVAGSVGWAKSE